MRDHAELVFEARDVHRLGVREEQRGVPTAGSEWWRVVVGWCCGGCEVGLFAGFSVCLSEFVVLGAFGGEAFGAVVGAGGFAAGHHHRGVPAPVGLVGVWCR